MSLIKLATIKINNTYLWHVSICLHVYINNNIRIIPMNTVIMFRNSGNAHLINPVCPIDNGKQSCDNGGQAVWYQNYIKDIFFCSSDVSGIYLGSYAFLGYVKSISSVSKQYEIF